MHITDEKLDALIQQIYDAALNDALWPSAVRALAQLFNAEESIMFSPRLSPYDPVSVLASYEHVDMAVWQAYEAYYWQHDVWANEGIRQGFLFDGSITHGDQFLERSQFRQSEIYCDMYKPHMMGIEVMMSAILIDTANPDPVPPFFLSFYKTACAEAFTKGNEQALRHVLPHIRRALRIRWKMLGQQQNCLLREQALEQMAAAILLLDATGRILFANRKAESLLRQGANPTVINGRLCSWDVHQNHAVKQALFQARKGIGSTLRFDNAAPIGVRVATFAPVPGEKAESLMAPVRIMVIMTELNQDVRDDLVAFAALYKLTPAETRVLKHLLQLQSTHEIAESLQVCMSTLRTQMKALFAKTHTKNQRELIRFCLSHPRMG